MTRQSRLVIIITQFFPLEKSLQQNRLILAAERSQNAVGDQKGFPADLFFSVPDQKIAAVHHGVKTVPVAIGIGNILKDTQAVENVVFAEIIVGQDLRMGQSKTGIKALVIRRDSLPFPFRLGINRFGAVHG